MKDWLVEAEQLTANLPRHREALDHLRALALPYTEAMKQDDRETHPEAEKLSRLHAQQSSLEQESLEAEDEDRDRKLAELDRTIERLEGEVSVRRTWQFADTETHWRHDTLQGLVEGLERLPDLIASVRERIARAERVRQETLEDHRADWQRALASIADERESPLYRGLRLEPQIGLVPIGTDPARSCGSSHFRAPARSPDGIAKAISSSRRTRAWCSCCCREVRSSWARRARTAPWRTTIRTRTSRRVRRNRSRSIPSSSRSTR
jgi:hypothetical protein